MSSHLPILLFLVPFFMGVSMPILTAKRRELCPDITLGTVIVMVIVAILNLRFVLTQGPIEYALGGWTAPLGIAWLNDSIAALIALTISVVSLITIVYGRVVVTTGLEKSVPYYTLILIMMSGLVGLIFAADLFNVFVFLEVAALTGYALVAASGGKALVYAFRYLLLGSFGATLYLLGLSHLYVATGTLNMADLSDRLPELMTSTAVAAGLIYIFLGLSIKMALIPLHSWLPDAHTQAPTPGSILLAGILLKTGAYGLLRFVWPLFPDAALTFAPFAMGLGVLSVLYGAKLAFAQDDLKRLIAYTSISHMGFISLGIFAWNHLSLQGTVMQIVGHGLSSAGLFAIAGLLQQRLHTRDLNQMGGLWGQLPKLSALTMLFAAAALGLPGLANFIGEFMVLLGVFQVQPWAASLSALGMILAPVYALLILQKGFFGAPAQGQREVLDLNLRELVMLGILALGLILLGFWPNLIFNISAAPVDYLLYLGKGG